MLSKAVLKSACLLKLLPTAEFSYLSIDFNLEIKRVLLTNIFQTRKSRIE